MGDIRPTLLPFVLVIPLPVPSPMRVNSAPTSPTTSGPSGAVFPATMLLKRLAPPNSRTEAATPPPRTRAVFDAIVLFTIDIDALSLPSTITPPPVLAEFPATVLFTRWIQVSIRPAGSSSTNRPPPSKAVLLPEMVLLLIVR